MSERRGFDALDGSLRHHVVSSLGWSTLRPLQEQSIEPLLACDNVLLVAPTAGGKTEAALLPVLSRAAEEQWRGLSILYVCPLRALLNNLEPRVSFLASFVGREAQLWHADVTQSARRKIRGDPPHVLLTTPESLEGMLTSRVRDPEPLLGTVRAVIVDELHAFAGDDRGWHLLAVLERVARLAGRDLQRVGLSATVGDPKGLLDWFSGSSGNPRSLVSIASPSVAAGAQGGTPGASRAVAAPEIEIDFVGTDENAATVLAAIGKGEKRLVFCDSRSRVERLTWLLRQAGVAAFASHGSLSFDERRQTEEAFGSARDAVIVATSTLEMGIDIGDLDRVFQLDAPSTVSSLLQRMGRSGRREGSRRNLTFLTTTPWSLVQATALVRLMRAGFVESTVPPPAPYHVAAQQTLGLVLQKKRATREQILEWLSAVPGFASLEDLDVVPASLVDRGFLFEDAGVLWFGEEGERSFGGRRFLELLSVFTSDPLISVRYGAEEIGRVDPITFAPRQEGPRVVLLGGRAWNVETIDWNEGIAWVTPIALDGRSLWLGSGPPLGVAVCREMKAVLRDGADANPWLTARGRARLAALVDDLPDFPEAGSLFVPDGGSKMRWWTFSGRRANSVLAERLRELGARNVVAQDVAITLEHESLSAMQSAVAQIVAAPREPAPRVIDERALEGLKFSQCLPQALGEGILRARLTDELAYGATLSEPVLFGG